SKLDRIIADAKDDWNCPGCRFGRERRGSAARYGDHADLMADQTGRKLRQPIISTFRRAVFDGHILSLDVTGFTKALPEWSQVHKVGCRVSEDSQDRHRRRLPACCGWPRRHRAAEQRDELAALNHSMTSSARARSVGGTVEAGRARPAKSCRPLEFLFL